jgi:AraC-like DNA-binding protein
LRTALDRLADDDADLATIANDLGFASHSHFDGRFKRTFGQSPSTVRALLGTGRSQTRTIMEALRASTA